MKKDKGLQGAMYVREVWLRQAGCSFAGEAFKRMRDFLCTQGTDGCEGQVFKQVIFLDMYLHKNLCESDLIIEDVIKIASWRT